MLSTHEYARLSETKSEEIHLPDINSFGICFLPAVETRYRVKFSMRRTTQEVINLCKLSSICFVDAACAALDAIPIFELLSPD